ncbi:MAG TPA: HEAT repeat domain-containing protein [Planctomycetaceae bacterium]
MAIDSSSDRHFAAAVAATARCFFRQSIPRRWLAAVSFLAAALAVGLAAYGEVPGQPRSPKPDSRDVSAESAEDEAADDASGRQPDPNSPSDQKLYRLTFSPDPQVRRAAIEAIGQRPPTQELRARIKQMADSDDNTIVRGHARLILADWQMPAKARSREPGARENGARENGARENGRRESVPRDRGRSSRAPGADKPGSKPALDAIHSPASDVGVQSRSSNGALPGLEPANVNLAPRSKSVPKSKIERTSFDDLADEIDDELMDAPATGSGDGDMDPLFIPDPDDVDDLWGPAAANRPEPGILSDPLERPLEEFASPEPDMSSLLRYDTGAPLGFTGPSGILPVDEQENGHFVPIIDRWRQNFPEWNRYTDRNHPPGDDYPYVEGHIWDPFNQNVLKGDYPIIGQHTFLNLTGVAQTFQEFRQLPTPATGHESTLNPFTNDAFGNPNQYFTTNFFRVKADLFHGSAGFKPVDWRVVVEGVFNMNDLDVRELGVVNPDVRFGTNRFSDKMALEQYFVEAKLADLSPDYDFVSVRAGSQPFVSDFRGFIFADTNRAVRLFGTRLANRDQFNVLVFDQAEKDTNSLLNTFKNRNQYIVIANYSRQDFIFPGYTAQASFHYNRDLAGTEYDTNNELVRPDAAGAALPHTVDAYYYGWAGDGHMGRLNISHAAYWVKGHDSMNPIAGRPIDIDSQMAAAELSYDRDWVRFRTSYFYASGQHEANSSVGKGFDSILDNPNFAGGRFSFWQRQPIKLLGVNLKQKQSLVPDLRSSKQEGQANFTNPGLQLLNAGMDFQVTPKARVFTNANYLWFDATQALEQFVFQKNISRQIGTDLSIGTEYRPYLNDNVIIFAGYAALLPGNGLNEIYGAVDPYHIHSPTHQALPAMHAVFLEMTLTY